MKSLVLLTFLSLSQGSQPVLGKAEYFDNREACQVRMQELRSHRTSPESLRCTCHETIPEISVEGTDGI